MKEYGLIGYPVKHSFSAVFFNDKFEKEGIDAHYSLFPLETVDMLPDLITSHPDLVGLNVTIPHKSAVMKYLDAVSDSAREIGAVNVIRVLDGGKRLEGYNSDAIGFRNSIAPLIRPYMKKALVLGTGGASKAVCHVLKELGLEVTLVSRKKSPDTITYQDLNEDIISSHLVIVNTTPLGTWPDTDAAPDIPYHLLTERHLCHDLVYNPEVTEFMRRSAKYGATVKNGLDMLHGQAVAAWEIWNR